MNYTEQINEDLIYTLTFEKNSNIRNGVYGYTQREFAFNSNKIEGSTLTKEHTASLFDNGSIYGEGTYKAKDIEEAQGHFSMFNYMLETLDEPLSEILIKAFHKHLKQCVFEDIANGYNIGEYKGRVNFVGEIETVKPSSVHEEMEKLLNWYQNEEKSVKTLASFHIQYEKIHPFQDGNGRTGRLILFRECLKNSICPFILQDSIRAEYIHCIAEAQKNLDCLNSDKLVSLFEKEQLNYYEKIKDALVSKTMCIPMPLQMR